LEKGISQRVYPRKDIWYVQADGANLSNVVDDACQAIIKTGLTWLEEFSNLSYALTEYQRPRELDRTESVAAFGTLSAADEGSAIAFALNDLEAAKALWQSIITSEYYSRFPDTLEQARSILSVINAAQVKTSRAR
jgi:hypothetical protein